VANSLAAVEAGARQIECTINGIGERAGNCALEEVVMAMKVRNDQLPYETRIVTENIYAASQFLSSIISFGPQPNKAIVGANAFAHEAGIHQDGYLKNKSTYEVIDPKSVGVPEGKLILGKHSGRHALGKRCEDLGFDLTKEELHLVYTKFTTLADTKKGILNDEILEMVAEVRSAAVAK
jgi:2-isopropylmalate synthase